MGSCRGRESGVRLGPPFPPQTHRTDIESMLNNVSTPLSPQRPCLQTQAHPSMPCCTCNPAVQWLQDPPPHHRDGGHARHGLDSRHPDGLGDADEGFHWGLRRRKREEGGCKYDRQLLVEGSWDRHIACSGGTHLTLFHAMLHQAPPQAPSSRGAPPPPLPPQNPRRSPPPAAAFSGEGVSNGMSMSSTTTARS